MVFNQIIKLHRYIFTSHYQINQALKTWISTPLYTPSCYIILWGSWRQKSSAIPVGLVLTRRMYGWSLTAQRSRNKIKWDLKENRVVLEIPSFGVKRWVLTSSSNATCEGWSGWPLSTRNGLISNNFYIKLTVDGYLLSRGRINKNIKVVGRIVLQTPKFPCRVAWWETFF